MRDDREIIRLRTVRRMLLVAMSAMALAACAAKSDPAPVQVAAAEPPEAAICQPDHALLVPPPAPDCEFGRIDLKTLDPDQWARLKLEYERKCYENAEKNVRSWLRQLQAANRCDAGADPR